MTSPRVPTRVLQFCHIMIPATSCRKACHVTTKPTTLWRSKRHSALQDQVLDVKRPQLNYRTCRVSMSEQRVPHHPGPSIPPELNMYHCASVDEDHRNKPNRFLHSEIITGPICILLSFRDVIITSRCLAWQANQLLSLPASCG